MANRRLLVKRRKAVRNIRKITKTMQMIATARFQAAYNRAVATKPYSEKLAELVGDLAGAGDGIDHPLMQTNEADRSALVVLTSSRGFCGSFNANVMRAAISHLDTVPTDVDVHMVGKKGINFFSYIGREMTEKTTTIDEKPRFDQVEPIANGLIERYVRGEIASAHVAYMRFISSGRQVAEVLRLLPLEPEVLDAGGNDAGGNDAGAATGARTADYEFSPAPEALLNDLLPASVRTRLFQCFTDSAVSEQVARMVAMTAATDAAGDMIKNLTRQYNRARQTHITMELLDIIGGVSALG